MRVLSNSDIEQVLTLEDCLQVLEVAYKEYALGQAANRPRNHTMLPVEDKRYPGFHFRFKSQEGGNPSSGVWALRITSDMAGVETLEGGVKRRRLIPAAPGNTFVGLITLYSLTTLEPLAVMHDSHIQKLRVGATSALGIRELSNPDARVAGMFGSGWQAEAHLRYLFMVRPEIEEVRVYSPTSSHRKAFVGEWSDKLGQRIVAVDHPKDAVKGCQIVTCATAAMDPCFDGSWLEPGTHVTAITSPDRTTLRRELDDTTFDRADARGGEGVGAGGADRMVSGGHDAVMEKMEKIGGRVIKFGDNVNTDVIIPGRYLVSIDPQELAKHAFEPLGAEVQKRLWSSQVVAGGRNFGCGSAREQAASCLVGAGIKAVVARSFARVFFRNCINTGLLVVECPEAVEAAVDGGELWIDYAAGTLRAEGQSFDFAPYPESLRQILEAGGLIPYLAKYVLPQEKALKG
ncbi:MAG: hypothetical protein HYV04_06620 [Deltaproteobacteria bacterium]|nr:hypothetical protein [Deltaproteobacteria bacterium]